MRLVVTICGFVYASFGRDMRERALNALVSCMFVAGNAHFDRGSYGVVKQETHYKVPRP